MGKVCCLDGRRIKRISRLAAVHCWEDGDLELRVLLYLRRGPSLILDLEVALGEPQKVLSAMLNDMADAGLVVRSTDHRYTLTIDGLKVTALRERVKVGPVARIVAQIPKPKKPRKKGKLHDADDEARVEFRAQHGNVIERNLMLTGGAPGLIVRCPLDDMHAQRSISNRQYHAGERLRDDYELGIVGARDPEKSGGHSSPDATFSAAQVHAATEFRRAIEALDKTIAGIVIDVVCGEMSMRQLEETRSRDRKKLMALLELGLDRLGDHYGLKTEITEEILKVGSKCYSFRYKHEPDGTVTGVMLNGRRWQETAGDDTLLVKKARKAIKASSKGARVHQAPGTARSAVAAA